MKYVLKILALGDFPEIEINETIFGRARESRDILTNALAIEEKYEILLQNYIEIEEEVLKKSVSKMVRTAIDYHDFFELKLAFNRLVVNLLTASRLYVDQLCRHVCACIPNNKEAKKIVLDCFKNEYDNNPEYRFMEALRNHVQHRGLAVHGVNLGSKWISGLNERMLMYSISIRCEKNILKNDPSFKKKVLDEMADKVDLITYIRAYISSLNSVHERARKFIESSVSAARFDLESLISRYSEICDECTIGLNAVKVVGNQISDSEPILLKWDESRVALQKRNRSLKSLRRRFVSGAPSS